jgi:hypothetical protein
MEQFALLTHRPAGDGYDAHHVAIGPFATKAEADDYLRRSETEIPVGIIHVLSPVADPSDDMELQP